MFDTSEVAVSKEIDPHPAEQTKPNWQEELKKNITTTEQLKGCPDF